MMDTLDRVVGNQTSFPRVDCGGKSDAYGNLNRCRPQLWAYSFPFALGDGERPHGLACGKCERFVSMLRLGQ